MRTTKLYAFLHSIRPRRERRVGVKSGPAKKGHLVRLNPLAQRKGRGSERRRDEFGSLGFDWYGAGIGAPDAISACVAAWGG